MLTLRQNQKALEQNEEALRVNNDELKLTREELTTSSRALEEQAKTLNKQTFEGTFFQLLSLHQDLTNSMDFYNKDTDYTTQGKDCFKVLYTRFSKIANQEQGYKAPNFDALARDIMNRQQHEDKVRELIKKREYINESYKIFIANNNSEVSHYFKSLYNIVKFVDDSDFAQDTIYIDTIRSQLSTYEAALLFYNEIYHAGRIKFKSYIEKYSLFKNMDRNVILNEREHMRFYESSAFGD